MTQRRATSRKKPSKKYKGYTATEQEFLTFGKWFLLVSFVFLVIAAIITTSPKLMMYSVFVGAIVAWGIVQQWFDA